MVLHFGGCKSIDGGGNGCQSELVGDACRGDIEMVDMTLRDLVQKRSSGERRSGSLGFGCSICRCHEVLADTG